MILALAFKRFMIFTLIVAAIIFMIVVAFCFMIMKGIFNANS